MNRCPEIVLDLIQVLSSTTSKRWPQFFHLSGKKNPWPSAEKNGDRNLWFTAREHRLAWNTHLQKFFHFDTFRNDLCYSGKQAFTFLSTTPDVLSAARKLPFANFLFPSLFLALALSLLLFMLEIAKIFGSIIKSNTASKHWMETNSRGRNFIQDQIEYQISR